MSQMIQVQTTVLPGHRIEICAPELPEGHAATVLICLEPTDLPKRRFREVLGNYPGKQAFRSAEEVEAYLRAERESWDS